MNDKATKTKILQAIGANLKAARQGANLSARELAERCGVQACQVFRWESGDNEPSIVSLLSACEVLGTELSEIVPTVRQAARLRRAG